MNERDVRNRITPRNEDFSQWYTDVILQAELADYAPVRGCIVFRPDGYALWEKVQEGLDARFKATGHRNAYFPLFIPESLMQKEAEHVEGFNPELPWVTEAGGEILTERLAIRPTSETIIGEMYSRWVKTYRDLPVLINQWCNVVRWEKRTKPFLRTTEFLWQEGHTAHRTAEEAQAEVFQMLEVYREFAETEMAIPVVKGRKSESEKFAGADATYSIEALMQDGLALQAATSHFLGQNFAKGFGIEFLDSDNQLKHAWTTSWGLTTRMIGALIMVHGDDKGLRLPPRMAPTQVVVVPIAPAAKRAEVLEQVHALADELKQQFRLHVDDREEFTPGWKFNDWEMRGVPVRVEIGPRDLAANQAVVVRRDTGEKETVPLADLAARLDTLMETVQRDMFAAAKAQLEANTRTVTTFDELASIIASEKGFVLAPWCDSGECEAAIKEQTKATTRNIPFDQPEELGNCVYCGEKAKHQVIFARAY